MEKEFAINGAGKIGCSHAKRNESTYRIYNFDKN